MSAEPDNNIHPTRRGLLTKLAWATIGLVAIATGGLVIITSFSPMWRRPKQDEDWSIVASLSEIPESKPTRFNIVITERTGWLANNIQEAIWIIRRGSEVSAFSAVCPHASCPISLEVRGFFCGCHGSQWTVNGEKIAGPTPRGMDSLTARVRGDVVEVKYQRFKAGLPQKELNV